MQHLVGLCGYQQMASSSLLTFQEGKWNVRALTEGLQSLISGLDPADKWPCGRSRSIVLSEPQFLPLKHEGFGRGDADAFLTGYSLGVWASQWFLC